MDKKRLIEIILTALFAALMAVGAYIRIPLPPVPITLQTLFALLCGLLLPLPLALSSLFIYLFLGLVGLPVFTSGGGFAAFSGPTGGYLAGLIPAILIETLMLRFIPVRHFGFYILTSTLATAAIYACGLSWLAWSRNLSLQATLAGGLYPFIIGDVVKILACSYAAVRLRDRVTQVLSKDGGM